jgi:hypothetical protein
MSAPNWAAGEFAGSDPFDVQKTALAMNPYLSTSMLLVLSNVFMTFAWYGHLKNLFDGCGSRGTRRWGTRRRIPAAGSGESNRSRGDELGQLASLRKRSRCRCSCRSRRKEKLTPTSWAGICLLGAVFMRPGRAGAMSGPLLRVRPAMMRPDSR